MIGLCQHAAAQCLLQCNIMSDSFDKFLTYVSGLDEWPPPVKVAANDQHAAVWPSLRHYITSNKLGNFSH
jgi:hypothetical protein